MDAASGSLPEENYMRTGREILRKCRANRREVLILLEKQEELRTSILPKAMQIKSDMVQASHEMDPMAERLSEVVDMESKIDDAVATMFAEEALAWKIIFHIKDVRYRCLLVTYYMTSYTDARGREHLHTFDTVAEENGYTPGTMRHYHKKALIAADKAAEELSI